MRAAAPPHDLGGLAADGDFGAVLVVFNPGVGFPRLKDTFR